MEKDAIGYAAVGENNARRRNGAGSVRTRRTVTRVITPGRKAVPRQDRYFDNTPVAVRRRRIREAREKRDRYREFVRRSKRLQKAKHTLIYASTFLLSVVVLFTVVYKVFFVVSSITVVGNSRYTAEEISAASGLSLKKTNLFSFSSSAAGKNISFSLPYITGVSFDRTVPNKVEITVTEEEPVFYAELYGDLYGLSESLTVLDEITEEDASDAGLIKLKLQAVSGAVAGCEITLASERAQRYLRSTVNTVKQSKLMERLDTIDLRDDFDTVMIANGKYKLDFGTQDDFGVKVKLAAEILEDPLFDSGNKAYINLEDTSKTSVIIDNQLVLD